MFADRATGAHDIIDGLSNTAAFSERVVGDLDGNIISAGDFRRTVPQDPNQTTATILASCTSTANTGSHTSDMSLGPGAWTYGHYNKTTYNHLFTPNSKVFDCSTNVSAVDGNNEGAIATARSFHPGVVTVLMADGSVRTVSDTVDILVWRGVGTRAGREALGEF